MQYEYFDEDKNKWVGLVAMHYHLIQGTLITMYGNTYQVREVKNVNEEINVDL